MLVALLCTLGLWSSSGRFRSVPLSLGVACVLETWRLFLEASPRKGFAVSGCFPTCSLIRVPVPGRGKGSSGWGWITAGTESGDPIPFWDRLPFSLVTWFFETPLHHREKALWGSCCGLAPGSSVGLWGSECGLGGSRVSLSGITVKEVAPRPVRRYLLFFVLGPWSPAPMALLCRGREVVGLRLGSERMEGERGSLLSGGFLGRRRKQREVLLQTYHWLG